MQPRKCPQCGETIEDDANYSFDDNLNLICGDCGKIAFPTDWKSNSEIDSALRQKKGGWGGTSWQDDDYSQNTFPQQNYGQTERVGVHGTNRVPGPLGGHVHGLSGRRPQVQSDTAPRHITCDRFGHEKIPCDDVDPSQRDPLGVAPFYG